MIIMKPFQRLNTHEEDVMTYDCEDENDSDDNINYPQHAQISIQDSEEDDLLDQTRNHRHLNIVVVRGLHYVEYPVGKPPQKVKLAVSLNSDHTVFRCSPYHDDCTENVCGSNTFNKFKSNSFLQLGCSACMEGDVCTNDRCLIQGEDWTAYRGQDYVIAEDESFKLSFGCQVSSGGYLDIIEESANGMISLSSAPSSFVNQQYREGLIGSTTFSLCFNRYRDKKLDNAGTLTIGGYKSDFLTSPMVYFKNTGIDGKYSSIITNIYLREGGGESVNVEADQKIIRVVFRKDSANSGPGTVIDTTYPGTLLNYRIGNAFKDEWFSMTNKQFFSSPVSLSDQELRKLPTILVQLQSSLEDDQFPDPNSVVGMVGDELDPASPQDVLLAIPATSYMLKQEDGMYTSMLSLDHKDGSVLGANVFQGRHLLFKTGYSSINSYMGIAETAKCNKLDPDEVVAASTPSPSIIPSDDSSAKPTGVAYDEETNRATFDSDGVGLWLTIIGAVLIVIAMIVLSIFYWKKRKKKNSQNANAAATDDFVSIDDDSATFVSYGLRSHLFSLVSSKEASDPSERQSLQHNRTLESRSREKHGTGLAEEEATGPATQTRANDKLPTQLSTHESQSFVSASTLQHHLILPQAQPIQATIAQPIDANPHSNNTQLSRQQSKKNTRIIDRGDGISTYFDPEDINTAMESQLPVEENIVWPDRQPKIGKPFLVRKGSIESSDDEDRTFSTRHSRNRARRQLELATKSRGSKSRGGSKSRKESRSRGGVSRTNYSREEKRALKMPSMDEPRMIKSTPQQRRQTIAMGSTIEHRIDPSTRQSSGTSNSRMDPMTTARRNADNRKRSPNSRPLPKNGSFSKRSTKASALMKASRRGTMELAPTSSNRSRSHKVENTPSGSAMREGTVIGVRGDESAISGLTDIGFLNNRKPPRRTSIASSRKNRNSSDEFSQRRDSQGHYRQDTFEEPRLTSRRSGTSQYSHDTGDGADHKSRISSRFSKRSSGESRRGSIGSITYEESMSKRIGNSRRSSMDTGTYISPQSRRNSASDYSITSDRYRRSSGESTYSGYDSRRSTAMMTIKENPASKGKLYDDIEYASPHTISNQRRKTGASDQSEQRGMPRSRGSLESFAKYQLDKEMKNRNLPAAPQYRIMKTRSARNSIW